jgi:hypothetical protein
MTDKKPVLLKFSAYFLLALGGLFSIPLLSMLKFASMGASATGTFGIIFVILIVLFVVAGIGLLKRQQWARVLTIIMFSLLLLSGFNSLKDNNSASGEGIAFNIGYWSAQLIVLGGAGLGLYAMIVDRSVRHYFDR